MGQAPLTLLWFKPINLNGACMGSQRAHNGRAKRRGQAQPLSGQSWQREAPAVTNERCAAKPARGAGLGSRKAYSAWLEASVSDAPGWEPASF